MIRETHLILRNCGIPMSPANVSRLVRTYKSQVEPNGFPFVDYVVNTVEMTVMQRRVVADELTRVIGYADPTGETAARNVDRSRVPHE